MKSILRNLLFASMIATLNAEEAPMKLDSLLDYKNVTITKVEPDGIRIMHESGAARIPYEKIPEELRSKLGMTQDGVDVHRDKVRDQQQKITQQNQKKQVLQNARLIFAGTIFQVTEDGVLLKDVSFTDGTKEEKKISYEVQTGGPSGLYPNARVTTETRYKTEWVLKVREFQNWPIYVECDTSRYADGDSFTSAVYTNGTYAYTNVQGARKTIPAYTTDPKKVLDRVGLGDDSSPSKP